MMIQRNRNIRSGFFYFLIFIAIVIYFATREQKQSPQSPPPELVDVAEELEEDELEFDLGGEPSMTRNFYIIFDGSGSMSYNLNGEIKIVGAKKAITKFLAQIPQDVNMGLYLFDDNGTREVVPLEPVNKDKLLTAISKSAPGGGTPLAEAILFATKQLIKQRKKQLGYGEYNLIIVTDGEADSIPEASSVAVKNEISI
jgi:Ca-activated chloride channel family protein